MHVFELQNDERVFWLSVVQLSKACNSCKRKLNDLREQSRHDSQRLHSEMENKVPNIAAEMKKLKKKKKSDPMYDPGFLESPSSRT